MHTQTNLIQLVAKKKTGNENVSNVNLFCPFVN
jgi:hypothetical protein